MSDRRLHRLALVLFCLIAGGLLGWLAGPALSWSDYVVQVAERVWLEQSRGLTEQTKQSEAFRATGLPAESLYQQAREVRGKFRIGGAVFGLWCGLVAGLSVVSVFAERRRKEYEPDPAHCLACGRCYMFCPEERERIKRL